MKLLFIIGGITIAYVICLFLVVELVKILKEN